jgi:NDP-sugar pyrophosphorylase family protein
MQCVILAGGLGTRIREQSRDLPKAMIPVSGKPFLFHQLEWLRSQQVDRVVLSIGYRGDVIVAAVGDGTDFGLSVQYIDEGPDLRGTAGALRLIAERGLLDPGFFMLYGDSYLPIEIAPVWQTSERGRFPTMTVLKNQGRWDRSNVVFREGELILYDKDAQDPAAAGMDYIDYGLFVLTRDVVVENIAPGAVADLAPLLHRLSLERRLRAHEVFERFYEIGSPQGLRDFEDFIAANKTSRAERASS